MILEEMIASTIPLSGDMAEIGVWKGRTAAIIHRQAPSKTLHLYDTFAGIVMADSSIDVHGNGEFSDTSVEKVRATVGPSQNIIFHVGIFPSTFKEHDRQFCFVFSDTDTYYGARTTLETFSSRMVPGGKIAFHDYGWRGCPGIKKAVDEFLVGKSLTTFLNNQHFAITFP